MDEWESRELFRYPFLTLDDRYICIPNAYFDADNASVVSGNSNQFRFEDEYQNFDF